MDLVWPASAWALWFAALAAAFGLTTRRAAAAPAAPAAPAPPAVVELLRGLRAGELFHATVFELARREWVTIRGDRLSLSAQGEGRVWPYEQWVLDRVAARLAGAPQAPVVALMPDSGDLDAEFVPLVRQSAIDLGLARRRWQSMLVPLLLAAALVVPWYVTISHAGVSWPGWIATAGAFVAGVALLLGGRGFLLTPLGREAAGPEPAPVDARQEWIFTGDGWRGVLVEPAPRDAGAPKRQEVEGRVVKRWIVAGHGDDLSSSRTCYVALHDGVSERAAAYRAKERFYQDVLPGDHVRLLVNPRRGSVVSVLAHERRW
ncbi:hypothetical protein ACFFV7_37485 [Nonomuraea spiralis]|uniref:DUF2207 domain-containing protein n=1 Tax=Nonomuraea spiralis TaxID=46182 RepID=A0ABV5IQW9_9ACTN|nr:hypothetical protein [Nonomuraea spiralis]GGT24268.1 hypothetical protein GCM10010176_081070 [Nonomuraea spiralis]